MIEDEKQKHGGLKLEEPRRPITKSKSPGKVTAERPRLKRMKTFSYEKYRKPNSEPSVLSKAKLSAPAQTFWTLIFYWDHARDSFRFFDVLTKLKRESPLTKS